jgi:pimeloyl-ACP methyl ester carboxylesterase
MPLSDTGSFGYDGFKIAYEARGTRGHRGRRPVVLIHGLLLSRIHHYPLADVLAEAGNQVVLIDLLGHGESDKPKHSRHYRMELFGRQLIALLDHLGIDEAVVGGSSLGANVTLEAAVAAPERVRAMILEMPVLERAAPAAGLLFLPLTIAYSQAATLFDWLGAALRQLPRGLNVYYDALLELLAREPVSSAAVLHGLLTGRIAPHPSEREKIAAPALVMGHGHDLLHPFSDAEALSRELPEGELVRSSSFFELRFPPNRLSDRIVTFLNEVWD